MSKLNKKDNSIYIFFIFDLTPLAIICDIVLSTLFDNDGSPLLRWERFLAWSECVDANKK
jgi:hypothetical protein